MAGLAAEEAIVLEVAVEVGTSIEGLAEAEQAVVVVTLSEVDPTRCQRAATPETSAVVMQHAGAREAVEEVVVVVVVVVAEVVVEGLVAAARLEDGASLLPPTFARVLVRTRVAMVYLVHVHDAQVLSAVQPLHAFLEKGDH